MADVTLSDFSDASLTSFDNPGISTETKYDPNSVSFIASMTVECPEYCIGHNQDDGCALNAVRRQARLVTLSPETHQLVERLQLMREN